MKIKNKKHTNKQSNKMNKRKPRKILPPPPPSKFAPTYITLNNYA